MSRTWKDKIISDDFFKKKEEKKADYLDYFFENHQWLIDRLKQNKISIEILKNGEQIKFKYFNWEQNYYPLTGENTLPASDRMVIREKQDVIVPSKDFLNKQKNRSGENEPRGILKSKKKLEPNSRKKVPLSKSYSKYTHFVDFVENFISRTNINPQKENYYKEDQKQDSTQEHQKPTFILDINQEIIDYLKKHPDFIYNISSRKFEELIAHILKSFGFDVELTKITRDGGRDIIAHIRNTVCSYLTFIECKHYSLDNPVGVSIIREVYGVQKMHRANKSLIVTSSYFTRDAIEETKLITNDLELKDHKDIQNWLHNIK